MQHVKDKEIVLNPGEFFVVPKGVEHMPYAPNEAHVLLFEPKGVVNTDDASSDKRVDDLEWL
ncbi:MAG: hypothetical protein S4CHLAM2_17060 [Chlamydiales bacterium]|nr:hypothetical protein [Chlamydiales bacterium]